MDLRDAAFHAAARVSAEDPLWFDPAAGPPPGDLPADCACDGVNPRGARPAAAAGGAFGLPDRHALVRGGVEFLLAAQNADGSWGDAEAEDVYERYHPTLTAVNGLRDYALTKRAFVFPDLAP